MRTVASVAVVLLIGWIAMKVVFGFAGGIIGLLLRSPTTALLLLIL